MPRYERQDSTTWSWLGGLLGVGLALVVVGVVVFPWFAGSRHHRDSGLTCPQNLKQIGVAIHMYMQDNEARFPLVSGFGPELDRHTALWGVEGTVLNRRSDDVKYMFDLLTPYVKNWKVFRCPTTFDAVWKVPGGEVDFDKNVTSYIFNAWYLKKPGSKDPRDRVEVAGQKAITCALPAEAPLVWDGMSGYAESKGQSAQLAHENLISVLYVDGHAGSVHIDPDMPPYNRTGGIGSHFWGAESDNPSVVATEL